MKLLILDLDETLLFGTEERLAREPDFSSVPYVFYKRPGVDSFLSRMSSIFELAVWTASSPAYADTVVSALFPSDVKLSFVWARDRCTSRYNPDLGIRDWVKNLDKLKKHGYDLESVIMVDDTPENLSKHYGNLVRVTSFKGNPDDCELFRLGQYLESLASVPNVRKIEKRHWQTIPLAKSPSSQAP